MNKETISVKKINEVYLHIDCSRAVAYELIDFFSFYVEGYRFMPAYKERRWDGTIKLFNTNGTLYVGLLKHLAHFCIERDYHLGFDPNELFIEEEEDDLEKYIDQLTFCDDDGGEIRPRDYQMKAYKECLRRGRRTIVSSTNSGKSLMIYMICHYLLHKKEIDGKILVIVPTTTLVRQMKGDFRSYSLKDDWETDEDIHEIMQGCEKEHPHKRIYVSTWQSIYKMPRAYFNQFDCVIGDEVHEFEAKSVKGILEKAVASVYRFGFTGTLKEGKTNKLVIEGLFGPSIQVMTNKKSIERKESADLTIRMQVLRWSKAFQKEVHGMRYADEMEWLRTSNRRNLYITGSVLSRKTNESSLILVNNVDQGKILEEMISKYDNKGRTVHFVYGKTHVDDRDDIRQSIDKKDPNSPGVIIIATFGVFQRGINIKNIHHLFFGSPAKSLVRVLQSLGRGLRRSKTKTHLSLWDIVDDLSGKRKKKNYSWDHGNKRLAIYEKEGFSIEVMEASL